MCLVWRTGQCGIRPALLRVGNKTRISSDPLNHEMSVASVSICRLKLHLVVSICTSLCG